MSRTSTLGLAALALTVSCDYPSVPPADKRSAKPAYVRSPLDLGSTARPSNRWSQEMFDLPDGARLRASAEIVAGIGRPCSMATEAVLRGGAGHVDIWRVTCSEGGDWLVTINPDSSTRVLDCRTVSALGDDCRAPLDRKRAKKLAKR